MPQQKPFLILLAASAVIACVHRVSPGQEGASNQFIRGDANEDGERDLSDAVSMLWCGFLGTACSACADSADVNDDGLSDLADPIFLLNFLFLSGAAPQPPGEACGPDPTADDLACGSFPRCAASDSDTVSTARGDVLISPVEHASLVLQWDQKTIYVDPVGGAGKFAGLPDPDVIFVTHTHGDHMHRATILGVAGEETVLVAPQAVSQALASAGGVGGLEEEVLANGEKATVAGIEIEAFPMYNANHPRGQGNGYILDLAGTRIYVAGDTEDIPEMRALQDISLAFIPMNLPYTMSPEKAASAVLEFKPDVVYPYHYRNQNGQADPNAQMFKMLVEAGSEEIQVRIRDWYP